MTRRVIATKDAPQAIGPYSQAVEAGGQLFVSGQIAIDPASGGLKGANVKEQTEQVIKNLRAILKAAGLDLKHAVKTTVYLTDLGRFAEMNEVYAAAFREPFPARATVEVGALPKGALVEIDMVAVRT